MGSDLQLPSPPFLIFPDQEGGFLLFQDPWQVFSGPEADEAQTLARTRGGWVAGGLQYAAAETAAPGWWGVFAPPADVSRAQLEAWADQEVRTGPLAGASYEEYRRGFQQVRDALEEGRTYQVNLTFALTGQAASNQPWSWRSALRLWLDLIRAQGREASFAVLGTPPAGNVLVSASPELFFRHEDRVVESRPMKGTAVRHSDPGLDAASRHELAVSVKTRAENLMVTDMLRNDLGRIAAKGGVSVPRLFEIEEYPTVWQMTSTVRAELPHEPALGELMATLFPCASITGAPKLSTQAVIAQAEGSSRGWYTGTLGWYRPASPVAGPSRSRFSVLIRTLEFDASGAFRLGVGGGVVWDSTVEGEWEEAWAKTRFLGPTQRTFSLTEAVLWTPQDGYALFEEHEARLARACLAFGGALAPGALRSALDAALASAGALQAGAIKFRVLVGPDFQISAAAEALSAMADELTAALAPRPLADGSLLWRRYKTTERRVYEQARVPGVDQTLYYNEKGELTESTSMNLVVKLDGRLLTPALSSGLLDGTQRARLIAEGTIEEAVLPVEALERAQEIWLINSVRGWKKVRLVGPPREGAAL